MPGGSAPNIIAHIFLLSFFFFLLLPTFFIQWLWLKIIYFNSQLHLFLICFATVSLSELARLHDIRKPRLKPNLPLDLWAID